MLVIESGLHSKRKRLITLVLCEPLKLLLLPNDELLPEVRNVSEFVVLSASVPVWL